MIAAAVELADEHGIDSVTMRELGRRLSVEAASLYNHVSGKDDVLNGMAEMVVAEIDVPSDIDDWQQAMRRRAVSARTVFARHPWAAALIDSRPSGGPTDPSYADKVLGILLGAGFSPAVAAQAFLALDSYIYGFERQRQTLGFGDDVDSAEIAQATVDAIPADGFPALMLVASEYAHNPFDEAASFEFGLDLLLDGLQRLLP